MLSTSVVMLHCRHSIGRKEREYGFWGEKGLYVFKHAGTWLDGLHADTALQLGWSRMHRKKCGEALPSLLTPLSAYVHRSPDPGHDEAISPAPLFGVPSSPALTWRESSVLQGPVPLSPGSLQSPGCFFLSHLCACVWTSAGAPAFRAETSD